jgi:hypothetical protein
MEIICFYYFCIIGRGAHLGEYDILPHPPLQRDIRENIRNEEQEKKVETKKQERGKTKEKSN